MYSVQKLAKMYNTTRQTMYTKLEHENIKPFVIIDNKGKKLLPDGINALNALLSDSKVNIQKDTNLGNNATSYIDKYIDDLKSQIERLENDKERLYFELEQQRKIFLLMSPKEEAPSKENIVIKQDVPAKESVVIKEDAPAKEVVPKKKGFIAKWVKKWYD